MRPKALPLDTTSFLKKARLKTLFFISNLIKRRITIDLTQIRDRIDQLDRQIAALLTERMDITNEVAAYKIEHNLPVYHPEREKQVIEKVSALTKEEYRDALAVIYQCIMDESKKNQEHYIASKK